MTLKHTLISLSSSRARWTLTVRGVAAHVLDCLHDAIHHPNTDLEDVCARGPAKLYVRYIVQ